MGRFRALAVFSLATGCHIVFPIEPWADASGDAPHVYSSPGPAAMLYGGYPDAFVITLAADLPSTTIYYTTDGSTPDESSPSAPAPVRDIMLSATATVRYFGVTAGARGLTTSEKFAIDTTAKGVAGYVVTDAIIDGTSPVLVVGGGSVLSATANVQIWVQSTCSACGAQLVYGIDDVDQGCLYDGSPGKYPGSTFMGKSFTITVPTAPGVHEVRIAHIEEGSCAVAMQMNTLASRPTVARIGVLLVK